VKIFPGRRGFRAGAVERLNRGCEVVVVFVQRGRRNSTLSQPTKQGGEFCQARAKGQGRNLPRSTRTGEWASEARYICGAHEGELSFQCKRSCVSRRPGPAFHRLEKVVLGFGFVGGRSRQAKADKEPPPGRYSCSGRAPRGIMLHRCRLPDKAGRGGGGAEAVNGSQPGDRVELGPGNLN